MHDAKQCSDKFICEEIVDGGFGNMFKGHINRGTRKTIVVGEVQYSQSMIIFFHANWIYVILFIKIV